MDSRALIICFVLVVNSGSGTFGATREHDLHYMRPQMMEWREGPVRSTDGTSRTNYPQNEYEYSIRRDYLTEKEEEMAGNNIVLNEDELVVDRYLQYLKYQHFEETRDTGFPPSRPIEEVLGTIRQSEVYRVLTNLPKGGNMHTYENHELSKDILLDIVWDSEDFQHLYILPENSSTPYILDFFINPPSSEWVKVEGHSYYTKERILPNVRLIGILSDESKKYPSDSNLRWDQMNTLWDRASSQLIANIKIKRLHMLALYEQALSEGIQYLETRKRFRYAERIYELSTEPEYVVTNGKKYLDETGELDIEITLNATRDFIASNPDFIGHKRITYTTRFSPREQIQSDMENALVLHKKFPDHIKGFDLVAEEDAGHSHVFFLEQFLQLYDGDTQSSKIELFLHTAETSFPHDLITSQNFGDPVSTAENAFDAILLGAKRVGHGLGYIKFPYLLEELKTRQIGVEICPVSNQLLGLRSDLRNHPAVTYMKMGIPVLLGADDPSSFGFDNSTVDWYEAFMAWGLMLKDLKQLSLNNLNYSAMSDTEKQDAITNKWTPYWNSYITTTREEACSADLTQNDPLFYRILPRNGAITGSTKVHVFGRNFERAVCSNVKCRFGQSESTLSHYVTNYHIICISPEGTGVENTVNLQVSLDDGQTYMDTGNNFTYIYTEIVEPTDGTPDTGAAATSYVTNLGLVFYMLCLPAFLY